MAQDTQIIKERKIDESTYEVEIKKQKTTNDEERLNHLLEAVDYFIHRNSEPKIVTSVKR